MSIKPTKNAYYCPSCGKTKMLFQTEKEALTFLRYNQEEIEECNGKAPVRAYYCDMCLGWHLTSKERAFNVSSSEILKRKLRIDAYHELSRFKATMDEIEQAYEEKAYSKILEPGLALIRKMLKVKLFSKEAQDKRQKMCTVVEDSFHQEMLRLTKVMTSGNYLVAYDELNAIIQLLNTVKAVKHEEIAVLNRRSAPYIARMQEIYERRVKTAARLEEQKVLLSIKSNVHNLASLKKLGKNSIHTKAIALIREIQQADEDDLYRPREELYAKVRSVIMGNIIAFMQKVDCFLLGGDFTEATRLMDELHRIIWDTYEVDPEPQMKWFYRETLLLISRRKKRIIILNNRIKTA